MTANRLLLLAMVIGSLGRAWAAPIQVAENVLQLGTFQASTISESSGVIASRSYPGAFWTHNDSDEHLFAVTKRGATLGAYFVNGVHFDDWEDIAIDGAGNLYLADIGDNNVVRSTLVVYKVREPSPYSTGTINISQRYYLTFPAAVAPADCESLFIFKGYGYIVTKRPVNGRITVFRFPLAYNSSTPFTLQFVTRVGVGANVSGADLSRDKTRLAFITEAGAYCFFVNGDIFSLKTASYVFTPFAHSATEGACFAGNGLLVTAETRQLYLFYAPAFQSW